MNSRSPRETLNKKKDPHKPRIRHIHHLQGISVPCMNTCIAVAEDPLWGKVLTQGVLTPHRRGTKKSWAAALHPCCPLYHISPQYCLGQKFFLSQRLRALKSVSHSKWTPLLPGSLFRKDMFYGTKMKNNTEDLWWLKLLLSLKLFRKR